jgi:hypothetical protein
MAVANQPKRTMPAARSMSGIVEAKKRVSSGTATSTSTMPAAWPAKRAIDGVPCHNVSSFRAGPGAPAMGVMPAGEGRPQ